MNMRTVLILVVALAIAGATAFMARGWINAQRDALLASLANQKPVEVEKEPGISVLVAKQDLPTGHFIGEEDLFWQEWPTDNVSENYILKGEGEIADFFGSVVRMPLTGGEPITEARVVRPGDRGFLAAVLTPGLRAVSVKIDATAGVAGFVFPGDRVDVILTHKIKFETKGKKKKGKGITHKAAETVLTNVRVLALDQAVNNINGSPSVAKTTTLEVTPKMAERLKLTAEMGRLSLSLRSLAKDDQGDDAPGKQMEAGYRGSDRYLNPAAGAPAPDANQRALLEPELAGAIQRIDDSEKKKKDDDEEGCEDCYEFPNQFTNPLGDMLQRFYRYRDQTYTWDAEVSQLIQPPVKLSIAPEQLHVGRGSKAQVYTFQYNKGVMQYLFEEFQRDEGLKEKDKNERKDASVDDYAAAVYPGAPVYEEDQ